MLFSVFEKIIVPIDIFLLKAFCVCVCVRACDFSISRTLRMYEMKLQQMLPATGRQRHGCIIPQAVNTQSSAPEDG